MRSAPLSRCIVYQHRVETIRINPYFYRTDGIGAGIDIDCRPKDGIGRKAARHHPKDVAGKVTPRLFLNRYDRLVQADRPLARPNRLRIIVTEEVAAEVKCVRQVSR